MMNISSFLCLISLLISLGSVVQSWDEAPDVVLAQLPADNDNNKNYITWDDLTLNGGQKRVIVVNKNGGGDSTTVQGAVDMVPQNNADRVKIHILPGVYSEKVHIPASKPLISLIGDPNQAAATVITWHDTASDKDKAGIPFKTEGSATVAVESGYFCASGITFQNSATGRGQAVALRISGDKSVFYESRFVGSQDTLLDEQGTHLFYRCFVQGTVDFIFGYARSLYKECRISVGASPLAIAAHGRMSGSDDTGFSFVNCTVTGRGPVYLGRAWGSYSRVIYSYTLLDIDIQPQGWNDWQSATKDKTVVFGEYKCRGRGANRSRRVGYSKELTDLEAKPFLGPNFISGELWLKIKLQ